MYSPKEFNKRINRPNPITHLLGIKLFIKDWAQSVLGSSQQYEFH